MNLHEMSKEGLEDELEFQKEMLELVKECLSEVYTDAAKERRRKEIEYHTNRVEEIRKELKKR